MVNKCETKYRITSCIEYKGKTLTVRNWAKEIGMHYNSLLYRLNSGMSIELAIETPININRQKGRRLSSKKYEYNGKLYTISELSEMSGISDNTLSSRISNGWSIKSAIETPVFSPKLYEYNGKKYTLRELAKEVGILHRTLKTRLDRNWTLEEAIGVKARTYMSNKKENKEMLSTDTKVTIHEDRSCTIPVVWTEAEDEIIKKSIRESISTHNTYLMLNRKHSADSIELRKDIIMRTMGIEYNYNNDEKKIYTMKDIVKCVYPNITLDRLDLVRATGRIREVLIALNLFDEGYCKKGDSTRYYNFTEMDINKICNIVHNKFPGGIKSTSIYMCANKEQIQVNKEDCEIDSVSNVCEDIKKDTMQQLPLIQQQYRVQINQFNEFINKLQQDNNTKFKQTKIHFDNNSVKFMVEWE